MILHCRWLTVVPGMGAQRLDPRTRTFMCEALKSFGVTVETIYEPNMRPGAHQIRLAYAVIESMIAKLTPLATANGTLLPENQYALVQMTPEELQAHTEKKNAEQAAYKKMKDEEELQKLRARAEEDKKEAEWAAESRQKEPKAKSKSKQTSAKTAN